MTSAIQQLQIIGFPASDQSIQGPFEVIGHANIISPNEISGLQFVDATNGPALQVPVQVLTGDKGQIHFLSLKFEETSKKQ